MTDQPSKTDSHSTAAMRWTVQDMGARPDYPNWRSYCIRDKATNVHLSTVGAMDRYFEERTGEFAVLMGAAPELLDALTSILKLADWYAQLAPVSREAGIASQIDRDRARAAIAKATGQEG